MIFNTSTLGYKLYSGTLKKHSEQLNKFVAGLFDADGHVSFDFCRNKIQIQSAISVCDSKLIKALRDHYNLGTVVGMEVKEVTHNKCFRWVMRTKDSKKFFNLIGKHLRIKGTHFNNLCNIHTELQEEVLEDSLIVELKNISKESRKNSTWIRYPKHPSYSWVAGYLAGDGHFEFRTSVRANGNRSLTMRVSSICHEDDKHILYFLQKAFRGSVKKINSKPHYVWKKTVGKGYHLFALPFLKKLRLYMCLEKKYIVIDSMVKYHEQLAETKCCETSNEVVR